MSKLQDYDIHSFGNTIQFAGVVFEGEGRSLLVRFPHEGPSVCAHDTLDLDLADWNTLLRQLDVMETQVLAQAEDGKIVKAFLRKSERQIEQSVSWAVFKRDNYTCRYCGKDGLPLTVDHLICWEEGGPSIADNLVSSCRRCNKTRGNTAYADWLEHAYYKKVSLGLSPQAKDANLRLLDTLGKIPVRVHKRSR